MYLALIEFQRIVLKHSAVTGQITASGEVAPVLINGLHIAAVTCVDARPDHSVITVGQREILVAHDYETVCAMIQATIAEAGGKIQ